MIKETKKQRIEILAKQLQVAGDPSRLKILCLLFADKKACVSDIAKKMGASVAIISHHLQPLVNVGILKSDREGKRICYSLSDKVFAKDLKQFICKYK